MPIPCLYHAYTMPIPCLYHVYAKYDMSVLPGLKESRAGQGRGQSSVE